MEREAPLLTKEVVGTSGGSLPSDVPLPSRGRPSRTPFKRPADFDDVQALSSGFSTANERLQAHVELQQGADTVALIAEHIMPSSSSASAITPTTRKRESSIATTDTLKRKNSTAPPQLKAGDVEAKELGLELAPPARTPSKPRASLYPKEGVDSTPRKETSTASAITPRSTSATLLKRSFGGNSAMPMKEGTKAKTLPSGDIASPGRPARSVSFSSPSTKPAASKQALSIKPIGHNSSSSPSQVRGRGNSFSGPFVSPPPKKRTTAGALTPTNQAQRSIAANSDAASLNALPPIDEGGLSNLTVHKKPHAAADTGELLASSSEIRVLFLLPESPLRSPSLGPSRRALANIVNVDGGCSPAKTSSSYHDAKSIPKTAPVANSAHLSVFAVIIEMPHEDAKAESHCDHMSQTPANQCTLSKTPLFSINEAQEALLLDHHSAAVRIQSLVRGHSARKIAARERHLSQISKRHSFLRTLESAIRIQSVWRGFAARQQYLRVRDAVVRIQSWARFIAARRVTSRLRISSGLHGSPLTPKRLGLPTLDIVVDAQGPLRDEQANEKTSLLPGHAKPGPLRTFLKKFCTIL